MALSVTHAHVSAIPDDGSDVGSNAWNAGHTIAGLGTNVQTFLETPTSANLKAALTDETGTGAAVFAGSPTLTGTITTDNIIFSVDNTYDIGASGATRPRNVYVGGSVIVPSGAVASSGGSGIWLAGSSNQTGISLGNSESSIGLTIGSSAFEWAFLHSGGLRSINTGYIGWVSGTDASSNGTLDLALTRAAAATLQLGRADAASPVAQTLKFQDVVAGTSNTAGVNATIQAPAGTGTGAGGSLIFQVAPAGSTGSAKNAWATALTIDSAKLATFAGKITQSGAPTAQFYGGVTVGAGSLGTDAAIAWQEVGAFAAVSGGSFGFTASTTAATAAIDTRFIRGGAAGIMGVRGSSATVAAALEYYTYGASPPAAGAASTARVYVDTSGGKDRLMCLFSSGAAQVLATQP